MFNCNTSVVKIWFGSGTKTPAQGQGKLNARSFVVDWNVEEKIPCFTSRGALQHTKGLYCVPVKYVSFIGVIFLCACLSTNLHIIYILKTFFIVFFADTVGSESLRPKYFRKNVLTKISILVTKPGIKEQV